MRTRHLNVRTLAFGIVATAVAVAVGGCGTSGETSASPRPVRAATVAGPHASSLMRASALDHPVQLNDGERLDPPPSGWHIPHLLTARQVWHRYAVRNHARISRNQIPADAPAYLALFTTTGDIKHRLVYGYRFPGCHPVYLGQAPPTPYPTGCVGWTIIDARTTIDLDSSAWEGLPEN